ncbi:MAG: hypothetical protein AAF310_04995, partial [Myxococcota bacterium]
MSQEACQTASSISSRPQSGPIADKLLDVASLSLLQLQEWMQQQGYPGYRGLQLFEALHVRGLRDLHAVAVLPQRLRQQLCGAFAICPLRIESVRQSQDGTRKYRMLTHDNHLIESVWIPHASREGRHALCISSQVGCAMGCRFCATAAIKLKRHLTAGEITAQVHMVVHDLQAAVAGGLSIPSLREPQLLQRGADATQAVATAGFSNRLQATVANDAADQQCTQCRWVDNVVFMGMGEPLHNCEQVMRAVGLLT